MKRKLVRKKVEQKATQEPAERDFPKFKKKRQFVGIFEYRRGVSKQVYQKLGFSVDGGLVEATAEADRIAGSLGRCLAKNLDEMKLKLCRVVAVYADNAFKDWEREAGIRELKSKSKEHIKEAAKFAAKSFVHLEKKDVKETKIGVRNK